MTVFHIPLFLYFTFTVNNNFLVKSVVLPLLSASSIEYNHVYFSVSLGRFVTVIHLYFILVYSRDAEPLIMIY